MEEPNQIETLHGLYITPFETKAIKVAKQGDPIREVTVDFEQVIKTVVEFFKSHVASYQDKHYSFDVFTAKDLGPQSVYVEEHVRRSINTVDFVVVDWTGLNPNVLLEAGYSLGRGKPFLNLTADDISFADRAGLIRIRYDFQEIDKLPAKLKDSIPLLIKSIETSPQMFDYHDKRATELVSRMIHDASSQIRILQTNLETVNANHLRELEDALKRGVRVKVLTLDPQSRYVNERAKQLGYKIPNVRVYRNALQVAIDNIHTMLGRYENFELRLYNDFPNQLTYLFDDAVLASIISRTGRSRENCAFYLPSGHLQGPKHTFIDHFEQLWDTTDEVE